MGLGWKFFFPLMKMFYFILIVAIICNPTNTNHLFYFVELRVPVSLVTHMWESQPSVQLEDLCCLPGWAVYCGVYLTLCVCTPSPQTGSCCYRATQRKAGLRDDTGRAGSATTDLLACLNLAFMILSQDRWPFASHHSPVLRLRATGLPERVPCHR